MRVILRDVKSGDYYKGGGKWTRELEGAKDYQSTARAIEAATRVEHQALEIVLAFDDPYFNMTLPVAKNEKPTGDARRNREK
jgi:hypothetical protein